MIECVSKQVARNRLVLYSDVDQKEKIQEKKKRHHVRDVLMIDICGKNIC